VLQHAANADLVVTVEEGTLIGGFGSAITDALVAGMGQALPRLVRLALPDEFPHHYGGQNDLWNTYGLMPEQIAATVTKLARQRELVADLR
jgi:transketolase